MNRIHNESSSFNHYPTEKRRINRRYVILEMHEITQITIYIYRKIIILIIHNIFSLIQNKRSTRTIKKISYQCPKFFSIYT